MASTNPVEEVIRSAWERRLLVIAVERVAIAAAVVLAALILMLVVGTQVLEWYWLVVLAVVGLGIAGYQVQQRMVVHYRVAQLLDRRLRLADSLSTAWYLLSRPGKPHDAISEFQISGAALAAQKVDVASAFPFTGRRLWLLAGGMALAAGSLFSVRYLVTNSLSLRQSLIPLRLSEVLERTDKSSEEAKRQRAAAAGPDQQGQKSTPRTDGQKDGKETPRMDPPAMGRANESQAGQNPNEPAELRHAKEGQGKDGQEKREGAAGGQQRAGEKPGEQGEQSAAEQKPSSNDKANSPQSSNGLIDRMKDALSSLGAKIRPNGNPQEGKERSGEEKKGDQRGAAKEENDASRQDANSQQTSEQQQASEGQAQGQTQEKTRSGQGKSADQSADKSKSDSHSGIGSQDGDKEMKDADQLKALGKLAEIIGRRSASATGDVMVENPAGKQHLQTEYSGHVGQHADLGGEINRDEIPLMYQQYVRAYMSQVRRLAKRHK